MNSDVYWPNEEFRGQPLFEIIFREVYDDLEHLLSAGTGIPDLLTTNNLSFFTRTAVLLLRESKLRRCSIYDAAVGMEMDLSDWTDWTITYATDFYMQ